MGSNVTRIVALREAEAQQFARQCSGEAIEFAPGDLTAAFGAENGGNRGPLNSPLRYHAVQQMAIGKQHFVIVEGEAGKTGGISHSSSSRSFERARVKGG